MVMFGWKNSWWRGSSSGPANEKQLGQAVKFLLPLAGLFDLSKSWWEGGVCDAHLVHFY